MDSRFDGYLNWFEGVVTDALSYSTAGWGLAGLPITIAVMAVGTVACMVWLMELEHPRPSNAIGWLGLAFTGSIGAAVAVPFALVICGFLFTPTL